MGGIALWRYAAGASVASIQTQANTPPGYTTVTFFDSNGVTVGSVQIPDGTPAVIPVGTVEVAGGAGVTGTLEQLQDQNGASTGIKVSTTSTELTLPVTADAPVTIPQLIAKANTNPATAIGLTGAGIGATASVTGTDLAGKISITTGTPCNSGDFLQFTFGDVHTNNPYSVVITPANIYAADIVNTAGNWYLQNVNNLSFQIYCTVAPATGTVYEFYYFVIGA